MPNSLKLRLLWLILPIVCLFATSSDASASASPIDRDTVGDMSQHSSEADKELFHIHGDAPVVGDPEGVVGAGHAPGYNLTQMAAGHPMCIYEMPGGQEMIVEVDVYQVPGAPMRLHLLCPHCLARDHGNRNALNISADNKQMSYEANRIVPTYPGWSDRQMVKAFPRGAGGLLSVERFRCSWEIQPEYRAQLGNICDFDVVIDKNVIRRVARVASGSLLGKIRSP
jgi:hypothetical protein